MYVPKISLEGGGTGPNGIVAQVIPSISTESLYNVTVESVSFNSGQLI